MARIDGRTYKDLRPVEIIPGVNKFAEGSCLIRCGNTHVLCTASVEERVPPHVPYGEGILPQIHKQEKRFHQNDKCREDMHQTTALFPHSPADALCHRRKCFKIVIRFKPEGHMRSFPKSCELAGTELCSARQNAVVLTEISGGCECSFSLVRRGRCLHRPVEKLRIRRRFL